MHTIPPDDDTRVNRCESAVKTPPHSDCEETPVPFDPRSERIRNRFRAASSLLVCLDFDGTLAPIVDDPSHAEILPANERILQTFAETAQISTAIVSGRGLADLRDRVDAQILAGNHGLELERDGVVSVHPIAQKRADTVQYVCELLELILDPIPHTRIENKRFTGTVHVRSVPRGAREIVRRTTTDIVTQLGPETLTVSTGKRVVEISPAIPWHKGAAVRLIAADHPADTLVIYIGDDVTDETAFRALGTDDITIKVGSSQSTAAQYTLDDPTSVATTLEWIGTTGCTLQQ